MCLCLFHRNLRSPERFVSVYCEPKVAICVLSVSCEPKVARCVCVCFARKVRVCFIRTQCRHICLCLFHLNPTSPDVFVYVSCKHKIARCVGVQVPEFTGWVGVQVTGSPDVSVSR